MPRNPRRRACSTVAVVTGTGCTRPMASCTAASRSWTPSEMRLKPRFLRALSCSAVVTRGSTSIAISAPGSMVKKRSKWSSSAWISGTLR